MFLCIAQVFRYLLIDLCYSLSFRVQKAQVGCLVNHERHFSEQAYQMEIEEGSQKMRLAAYSGFAGVIHLDRCDSVYDDVRALYALIHHEPGSGKENR